MQGLGSRSNGSVGVSRPRPFVECPPRFLPAPHTGAVEPVIAYRSYHRIYTGCDMLTVSVIGCLRLYVYVFTAAGVRRARVGHHDHAVERPSVRSHGLHRVLKGMDTNNTLEIV